MSFIISGDTHGTIDIGKVVRFFGEHEEGWKNLEKAGFQVDYILMHTGPGEVHIEKREGSWYDECKQEFDCYNNNVQP